MASRDSLPHRKRKEDEAVNRLWNDEELMRLIDLILKGHTYRDVTKNKTIPMSTLWTRVKGKYQGEVRPKTGAPGIFPHELECEFALYLKHCDLLRIPKTRQDFKYDIWHYVEYYNMTFKKLQEDGPGRSWFERFEQDWKELVEFKTKGVIFQLKNDPITMRLWTNERDNYTKIQKEEKKFPSKEHIFVVETKKIHVTVGNKVMFDVLMIYNAEGQVLKPFVMHQGNIPKAVQKLYEDRFTFFVSDDGELTQSVLVELCMYIERCLSEKGMFEPPVIYMCPGVSEFIGFTLWDMCNKYRFIMQTVLQNIYNYLKTSNLGMFDKLEPLLLIEVAKHFPEGEGHCFVFNYLQMFNNIISSGRLTTHLHNSCRRLRIVAVIPVRAEQATLDQDDDLIEVDDADDNSNQAEDIQQGTEQVKEELDPQEEVFAGSEIQNIIAQSEMFLTDERLPDL